VGCRLLRTRLLLLLLLLPTCAAGAGADAATATAADTQLPRCSHIRAVKDSGRRGRRHERGSVGYKSGQGMMLVLLQLWSQISHSVVWPCAINTTTTNTLLLTLLLLLLPLGLGLDLEL
jgi:hypothetical protein